MKINSIERFIGFIVETDDEEWPTYTRFCADNWTVRMGESEEQVYHCEELEALFQEYVGDRCL